MIVADAVKKLTQSELSHWQSVGEPHDAILTVSDHMLRRTITRITDKIMTVKCVTTIPCIDPADLSINISD